MNEETTSTLLTYLATLGFEGQALEQEIRSGISSARLSFTVPYRKDFDDEQMLYDLKFRYDMQFEGYRFEGYKASLRKPIVIEHKIINGIDTQDLGDRMKHIDWADYFGSSKETPNTTNALKVMSDIWDMEANKNPEGIKIRELLELKYFPERYYDERIKELRSEYDRSRDFTVTERGICNTNLAYHILSGRLDELHEKLQPVELDRLSGKDTYSTLERILSRNPDSFELKCLYSTTEGDAEIVVPVSKTEGRYAADNYNVRLTPYPAIEHGTFNGIDTRELEGLMQKIDWKNDSELFTLHEDKEPELTPQVEEIAARMNQLSKDADGVRIADQLKLKYWTDASFFDALIEERAWKYLESLPKRVQRFPVTTKAKAAFNLLCGRAVLDIPLYHTLPEIIDWKRLDLSQKGTENNYPVQSAGSFSKSELEKLLNLLPIDSMDFYAVKNGLKQGDLLPVQLTDGRKVMLVANPEQKTIDIFTLDMRPIPVNLRLDPDWSPSVIQKENAPEIKQSISPEPKQNVFSKQSKKHHKRGRHM